MNMFNMNKPYMYFMPRKQVNYLIDFKIPTSYYSIPLGILRNLPFLCVCIQTVYIIYFKDWCLH